MNDYTPTGGSRRDQHVTALGAAALAVAPFLPWVHVPLLGNINLLSLMSAAGVTPLFGVLVSVIGIAVLLAIYLQRNVHGARIGAVITATVLGLIGADITVSLFRAVRETDGLLSVGVGCLLATVGVLCMFVGGVVGLTDERRTAVVVFGAPRKPLPIAAVTAGALALALIALWLPITAGDNGDTACEILGGIGARVRAELAGPRINCHRGREPVQFSAI